MKSPSILPIVCVLAIFSMGNCFSLKPVSLLKTQHRLNTGFGQFSRLSVVGQATDIHQNIPFVASSETPVSSTRLESGSTLVVPDPANAEQAIPKKSGLKTFKKLFPLGAMLFFILFNYTILRDTKDVLVVTSAGAEIIPFLKTYVNLPSAVGFTMLYSALCNRFSTEHVFYLIMTSFLGFFGAFAAVICKSLSLCC